MALELVYTSATRGLREGTSGFCTVAMTRGLPMTMVPRLEALGGYRPGPQGDGPVALSFWRLETSQGIVSVLARVGPTAPDHTQRSNKLATYVVLGADEHSEAGPAWLLANIRMRDHWEGTARWLDEPFAVPQHAAEPIIACRAWQRACGDAGWAGVLASTFLRDMGKPAYIIYGPSVNALELVDEAQRLLPPWAKWRATFSTYFLQPVAGAPCCWRFCLDGTAAAEAARAAKGLVIDLTRPMAAAPDSRHVRAARTGVLEQAAATEVPAAAAAGAAGAGTQVQGTELWSGAGSRSPSWADGGAGGPVVDEGPIELEPLAQGRRGDWHGRASARMRVGGGSSGRDDLPLRPLGMPMAAFVALLVGVVALVTIILVAIFNSPSPPPRKVPPQGPITMRKLEGPPPKVETPKVEPAKVEPPKIEPSKPSVEDAPPQLPVPPDDPPVSVPTDTPQPTEPAPAVPAPAELEWLTIEAVAGQTTLDAEGEVPADLRAVSAVFVVPSSLSGVDLQALNDQIKLPANVGVVQASLAAGRLKITMPASSRELDLLAPVLKLRASAQPVEFARALLARVHVELRDATGATVGRVRIGPPKSVTGNQGWVAVRAQIVTAEPALTLHSFVENKKGSRTPFGQATVVQGQSADVPVPSGIAEVEYTVNRDVVVTNRQSQLSEAAKLAQRGKIGTHVQQWQDLQRAVAVLEKRGQSKTVGKFDVEKALATVTAALTDDERALLRDARDNALTLAEAWEANIQMYRSVVKRVEDRCQAELDKLSAQLRALDNPSTAKASEVPVIDISGEDGMVLVTVYPEGKPR